MIRIFFLLSALFLFCLHSCGLSVIVNIPAPPVISVDNKAAQVLLSSAYMQNIPNFRGLSFFYKIYPYDSCYYERSWTIYSSFSDAYQGDYKRLKASYSAEEALFSYGYLPFNRDEFCESSLPIIKITSQYLSKDLVLTLDFINIFNPSNTQATAEVILKDSNSDVQITGKMPLLRRVMAINVDNRYKTFSYLTYCNLISQKDDIDLRRLPKKFLEKEGEKFNIVIYGVVYAGDVFNPLRSQAFRVGCIEGLISGKESLR